MGLSSLDCKNCGHPALAPHATVKINAWMQQVVAILPDGNILQGYYGGYLDIDGVNLYDAGWDDERGNPLLYHRACWEALGKPSHYDGTGSRWSFDQGHFFARGAHSSAPPGRAGYFEYAGPTY